MIVGNEIHGLKVKHLHVGGVLGSGEVQNGIKGCIQVKMNQLNFLMCIDGWVKARWLCWRGRDGIDARSKKKKKTLLPFPSSHPHCLSVCLSAGCPARCEA